MTVLISRRSAVWGGMGAMMIGGAARITPAKAQMEPAILDELADDGRFARWLNLIQEAGFGRYMTGRQPFTMFAPTDDALSKYGQPTYDQMLGINRMGAGAPMLFPDLSRAIRVIRSNVVAGLHPPAEFLGKKFALMNVMNAPIDIDGTAPGPIFSMVTHVMDTVSTAKADSKVIAARGALVYPIDSFSLEAYLG